MTTLENSQQSDWLETELELMSSREGSPARTSQLQESKRESVKEPAADYGQKSLDLLASYDPDTQSWRTSQLSLVETTGNGLAEFSETWPRSGMTRNGTAYRLPNLARTITEIGSGLLPTPAATEYGSNQGGSAGRVGKIRHSLSSMARNNLWQTPVADDAVLRKIGKFNSRGEPKLSAQVKMYPTPRRCQTGAASENRLKDKFPNLEKVLSEMGERGHLNPQWVEWLMGYPIGHTDLKDLETP
jgi:hypothetical protein